MSPDFEDSVPDILSDNFFEVIVVGGGTCGLAVAARLCEDTPGSIYTDDEHQRFHWLRKRGNKVSTLTKSMKKHSSYTAPLKLRGENILVLDAVADTFLGQWDNQFRSCQIPVLRSPMFFHPDPQTVDAMISYAHLHRREKELMEIPNVVGREYSKHQHKREMRKHCNKCPAPTSTQKISNHDRLGIIDINMRDWRDYYRPSTKFFRDFCQDLIDRYNLGNCVRKDEVASIRYGDIHIYDQNVVRKAFVIATKSGQVYASASCVVASGHRGEINYPIGGISKAAPLLDHACHLTHIFNKDVQFPHPGVPKNGHIVVVGGGLTSAQLAHVACLQGYKVTLLLRGTMKIKHFDFHLDWVTKYKNVKKLSFYMLDTDEDRLQLILDAREGGLVNPEYYNHLNKHVSKGMLTIRKYSTIEEGELENEKWTLKVKERIVDDKVQFGKKGTKGKRKERRRSVEKMEKMEKIEKMEKTERTECGVCDGSHEVSDSASSKSDSSIFDSSVSDSSVSDSFSPAFTFSSIQADYVCCATGIRANLAQLSFMAPILRDFPIDIVGGLPCLTDHLQWNEELPLFMVGKNASLRIGPTSANLDGARTCAERVGWKIQEDRAKDRSPLSVDTLLQLAAGRMNWYSLLQEA